MPLRNSIIIFANYNYFRTVLLSTGCLVINMSHLEVNNSASINDIILCFSGLIENRITFHLIKEMVWSIEERTFCVTLYLETKSLKTVQVRYCRSFNFNNFSHKFQITHWVKTFKDTGTLITSTKKGQKSTSGRKLTARSPENVDAVKDSVGQSPKKSLRRCSQELGLSRSSVHRILKNDLQLYPYRIQIKQTLTQNDMAKRVEMCQWFESKIEVLQNVWFSDEAHFSPSGHVNSKNSVFWGSQAPQEVLQRPLHSVKGTAWVAILKHGINGPFWLENDVGETMTVYKEHYIVVLNKFWGHSVPLVVCIEKSNGCNKKMQLPIQLTSLWNGWIVALQVN